MNKAEVEVCRAKKGIVQAYGWDGEDLVKKKGTAGFSSHHWCPHCHADQSCKHKLTFLHPEIKPIESGSMTDARRQGYVCVPSLDVPRRSWLRFVHMASRSGPN